MENKTLILIAILFAIIGIVGAGIQYLDGIICNNCSFTGNTTFDEIKVNKISKNDTLTNNSIIISGDLKSSGDFRIKGANELCDIVWNGNLVLTCVNLNNPDKGTQILMSDTNITLDYADPLVPTHVDINSFGIQITCSAGAGVTCIS